MAATYSPHVKKAFRSKNTHSVLSFEITFLFIFLRYSICPSSWLFTYKRISELGTSDSEHLSLNSKASRSNSWNHLRKNTYLCDICHVSLIGDDRNHKSQSILSSSSTFIWHNIMPEACRQVSKNVVIRRFGYAIN